MINVANILGQPAVALGDAERTGKVTGLRFAGNRIAFVEITGGRMVPGEAVRTFEGDALTYDGESVAPPDKQADPAADEQPPKSGSSSSPAPKSDEAPAPAPEAVESPAPWSGDPIGKVLLSTAGEALGELTEMHIGSDGVVVEITDGEGHSYEGERLVTVGSYAAILKVADPDG